MIATGLHAAGDQARHIGRADGAVRDATLRGGHFDHRLQPQHAARAVAHHAHVGLHGKCRGDLIRTGGTRCRIARDVDHDAVAHCLGRGARLDLLCGSVDDRRDASLVDPAVQVPVDCHRRPERTVAEAEDLLDFDSDTGCQLGGLGEQTVAAAGLAGLGATDLHDGSRRLGRAEVVVEADDAVHLGHRLVEDIGQHRNRLVIDVSELVLQRVQRRHEATRPVGERTHDRTQVS